MQGEGQLPPGRRTAAGVLVDADGNVEFDYDGETEVFWDDSTIVKRDGKIVYLDEHGHDITQDNIILVDKLPESGG